MSLSIIPTARRKPRAFLLQIGVDHYQASSCDLRFSGMDAQRLSTALDTALHTRGFEVIAVRLTTETSSPGATKQEIRQALAHIAAQATPDDLFVLSFSGHGYGTKAGEFYIMPSDIQGSCYVPDQALLQNAISATELADWLRPIDAGELTFVLDACFSARSVESNDFKPGPMGSAGLGQLAYDKRMRILAASQSDQTAEEYASLQSGLLTYVLAEQGLVEHKADWQPRDGKILLGEWLAYAAAAVPIFEQNGMEDPKAVSPDDRAARSRQLPAVFDFTKADALVLATVPHAPAAGHNAQARPQP